jgi:predicted regulator of Ras-like GTPase activity (Roadblock/LC7/MglB family)
MESLRSRLAGATAIVLVGPSGVVDHVKISRSLDVDAFASEYATLLRIARRTSEDAGTGKLIEHIVVSQKSVIVARSILSDYFLIAVVSEREHLGRARYELKRLARDLQRIL